MNCWNRLSPGTAQRHCKHIFQSRSFQKEAADGNETGSCWIRTPWVNYLCASMSDSCKSFCPNCASWAFVLQARPAHLLIGCASCGELGRFPSEPHPNPAGPYGTACGFDLWLPWGVSFYHLCGFGTKSITVMRYWPSKKDYCRFKSNQSDCGLPARGKWKLNMVKIR